MEREAAEKLGIEVLRAAAAAVAAVQSLGPGCPWAVVDGLLGPRWAAASSQQSSESARTKTHCRAAQEQSQTVSWKFWASRRLRSLAKANVEDVLNNPPSPSRGE